MKYITTVDGVNFEVELLDKNRVSVNGKIFEVDFEEVSGQLIFSLIVNGKSYEVHISEDEDVWHVLIQGTLYTTEVIDEREKRLRAASGEKALSRGEFVLQAPMPGLVVKVPVKEGDQVKKGSVLVILESMKMQNELKSPREGTVSQVTIKEGDNVEKKDVMVVLASEGE
jgi:biotin carboxyl carrier protein